MGNHEHYKGKFYQTHDVLKQALGANINLHILDNESVEINGVKFFGTTLWTDFNRDNFGAKLEVQNSLNDYRLIQNDKYQKLRPADTLFYHREALRAIEEVKPDVLVGHHAPSWKSISPRFQGAGLINYGYYSDLERFIANNQNIKLWTHGHVHSSADYMLGDTRVVANPRGYSQNGVDENGQFNPNLVLEI